MEEIGSNDFVQRLMTGKGVSDCTVNGEVNLSEKCHFPVALQGVTFSGKVYICDCHFSGDVTFNHCTFEQGAFFSRTSFSGSADFSGSNFKGPAYFWRARFDGPATFDDVVIESRTEYYGSVDPSEVNFSWAHFHGRASFVRMRINGPAWFWRTLFFSDVAFEQVLFGRPVRFMGRVSDVSIDLFRLGNELHLDHQDLFDRLTHLKLIDSDTEVLMKSPQGRTWYRFAQLDVKSEEELKARLLDSHLPAPLADRLLALYRQDALPMFSPQPEHKAFITRCEVSPSATISFIDVDMSRCRLLGTTMERTELINVRWPSRRILVGLSRLVTEDETDAAADDLPSLQRLYRELATVYERSQESANAASFRISHREIARRRLSSSPFFFASAYRFLALYGESPGLATFWLVFFVIVFFPVLFCASDGIAYGPALVRSLEVSTFLTSDKQDWFFAARIIAGTERVVVTTLVAVFLLTMKRILPP